MKHAACKQQLPYHRNNVVDILQARWQRTTRRHHVGQPPTFGGSCRWNENNSVTL